MASVPTVTQRSVFPSDEILPTSNLRGSDAGLIFAEGVVRAGQTISHAMDPLVAAAAQIQAEDDKREVDKLDIEYSTFLRDITYGDGTEANPGFMNSLGENAINGYNLSADAITKKRADLLKRASNKTVADAFNTV